MKLYIAVLDEVPDFIVPTLVAHSVLGAHLDFYSKINGQHKGLVPYEDVDKFIRYTEWLTFSFKKCVVRVSQKEFDKITAIPHTYLGHENKTLNGRKSCAIPLPVPNDQLHNVLKFAKLWKPKFTEYRQGCLECDEVRVIRENDKEWRDGVARGKLIVDRLVEEERKGSIRHTSR